jgi:hypothetical protein
MCLVTHVKISKIKGIGLSHVKEEEKSLFITPTLPEKQILETKVLLILETIDDILAEFDRPTHFSSNKSTFLETLCN